MIDGFQRDFRTPLMVGVVLSVALAVTADLLLVGAQRLVSPWARARAQ
jgi:osmoprotectant transport system permease protein